MGYKFNPFTGTIDFVGTQVVPYFPTSETQERPQETVITNFQSGHGFTLTSGGGAIADDTDVFCRGSQSLKLTTKGDGTQLRVTSGLFSPTINLSGKVVKILLRCDDPSSFMDTGGQVFIGFSSDNFGSHYFYYSATYTVAHEYGGNSWIQIEFSPSNQNTTGSPDLTAINAIRLYVKDHPVGVFNIWFQSISYYSNPAPEGIVSIVFDDGHFSQYTEAVKKMSQYGFPGTAYIMPDQIGTAGYLTLAQAKEMQDANGWDISAHYNTNLTTLSASEVESVLKNVKNYLITNGFSKGADHLAYPNGDYNQTVLPIVKKYFRSGRQSSSQSHALVPTNTPYRIKAFSMSNGVSTAALATEVANCIANKDWLVVVYHRIVASPSIAEDHSITNFGTEMDNIATSGVRVMTVSDVFNHYPILRNPFYIGTTPIYSNRPSGALALTGITSIDGLAATATKLAATKTINSVPFDGSANIRTPNIQPSDHNVLAWTYDPAFAVSSDLIPTAGTIYVARIFIPYAMTISNIIIDIATAGNTLANSFVALYQNNTLLAQSSDQSTSWQTGGMKTIAITPQNVVAGSVEVAVWVGSFNTAPKLLRASSQGSSVLNLGLSAANSRWATADTSITTTAPNNLGTHTGYGLSLWAALS